MTRRPSAAKQGGTIETPQGALERAIEAANIWKDSANLYYSTILDALAQARSELATSERERIGMFDESAKLIAKHAQELASLRACREQAEAEAGRIAAKLEAAEERCRVGDEELQRVTRERDEAQSALAELQGAHRDD